jgi:hypothetical protein
LHLSIITTSSCILTLYTATFYLSPIHPSIRLSVHSANRLNDSVSLNVIHCHLYQFLLTESQCFHHIRHLITISRSQLSVSNLLRKAIKWKKQSNHIISFLIQFSVLDLVSKLLNCSILICTTQSKIQLPNPNPNRQASSFIKPFN